MPAGIASVAGLGVGRSTFVGWVVDRRIGLGEDRSWEVGSQSEFTTSSFRKVAKCNADQSSEPDDVRRTGRK